MAVFPIDGQGLGILAAKINNGLNIRMEMMGRGSIGLDLGNDLATQDLLGKLPAITGRDEPVPAVALLDQLQLRGEVNAGLCLKTVDYFMAVAIKENELDTS